MSIAKSPLIVSSQTSPHKNLAKLIMKYQNSLYQDSIPKHAINAFDIANEFVLSDKVILDSGCGTGESSYRLAKKFPQHKVIAADKSNERLQRRHANGEQPDNLLFVQIDCVHLWRLIKQACWNIERHYLFYPNPWPKPGHLQRRWHGHPIFPVLLSLGGLMIMRTNWNVYAHEFVKALQLSGLGDIEMKQLELDVDVAFTPFERKYLQSEHQLYEVRCLISYC
ncbi:MAG: methyltransferase domain-containing protein [Gammaproteobacteria bacterium]|nr:methyltransferase domain-containing protein [Gammaproteobacteria bacterium]